MSFEYGKKYSDEDLGLEPREFEYGKKYSDADIMSGSLPQQAQMAAEPESNNFVRGMKGGLENLQATGYGALGLAGQALGLETVRDIGFEGYQRNIEEAKQYETDVPQFTDIDWGSLDSVTDWVAGTAGQLIPSIAESVVAAGIGAGIGGATGAGVGSVPGAIAGFAGKTGIKRLLRNQVAKTMKTKAYRELAKKEGRDVARAAANKSVGRKIGAGIGVIGGVSPIEAGSMWGEDALTHGVENANWMSAALLGLASGASELVAPGGRFARGVVGEAGAVFLKNLADPTGKKLLKRLGIEIPKSMAGEAGQEAFQELLSKVNEKINDTTGEVTLTEKEDLIDYLNSAAAGALGGGMFGAAGALRTEGPQAGEAQPPQAPQDVLDTAIQAEMQAVLDEDAEHDPTPYSPILPGADQFGEVPTADPFTEGAADATYDDLMRGYEEGGVPVTKRDEILGNREVAKSTMEKLKTGKPLTDEEEIYRDEFIAFKKDEAKEKAAAEKKAKADEKKRKEFLKGAGIDLKELDKKEEPVVVEKPEFVPDRKAASEFADEDPHRQAMESAKAKGGISIDSAKQMFSKDTYKELSKPGLFTKDGQQIDDVATQLGYESANDLVNAWSATGLKKEAVAKAELEQKAEFERAEDAQRIAPVEEQSPEDFKILADRLKSGEYQMTDEEIEGMKSLSVDQKAELLGIQHKVLYQKTDTGKQQIPASPPPKKTRPLKFRNKIIFKRFYDNLTTMVKGDTTQANAIGLLLNARAGALGMSVEQYIKHRKLEIITDSKLTDEKGVKLSQSNKGAAVLSDYKSVIHAFTKADGTTAIHELAHVFRRDLSDTELAAASKWVGARPKARWTEAQEEQFARAFEKYLMTGQAPTTALQNVFAKLKQIMMSVYKSLSHPDLNVEVSPEIKSVFDSMLTDKEGKQKEKAAEGVDTLMQAKADTPDILKQTVLSRDEILDTERFLNIGLKIGKKAKIYRGISESSGVNAAKLGRGLYTTTDKKQAGKYGDITEMSYLDIPKNPIRFDNEMAFENWFENLYHEKLGFRRPSDFEKEYGSIDHFLSTYTPDIDGVQIGVGHGAFFVKFPEVPDILKQAKPADKWYSPTAKAAANLKQEKGSGKQMYAMISKTPGVKTEELEWIGLEEWLAPQKSVTREQIAEFIEQNGVQVEEVVKGGGKEMTVEEAAEQVFDDQFNETSGYYDDWMYESIVEEAKIAWGNPSHKLWSVVGKDKKTYIKEWSGDVEDAFDSFDDDVRSLGWDDIFSTSEMEDIRAEAFSQFMDTASEDDPAIERVLDNNKPGVADTKHSAYQLPGGENYKELLLTLPETPPVPLDGYRIVNYYSSHYDEPNILAHIRFNERTDADGNRVLFLEEVQSDHSADYRKQLKNIEKSVTNDFKDIVRNMESLGILEEIC